MKLMYRGAEYNYEPTPVNMSETGITGHYRGQAFKFAYPRHIPAPQPAGDYQYRGIVYHRSDTGNIEPVRTTPATASATISATAPATSAVATAADMTYRSVAASRQALLKEIAGKHRENIQRRLQHRLEVAKAKGDDLLISQLEREMQHIAH